MQGSIHISAMFLIVLISSFTFGSHDQTTRPKSHECHHQGHGCERDSTWTTTRNRAQMAPTSLGIGERGETLMEAKTARPVGSRLPDCSHACGSCSPCKLVIVSPICGSQSEACPVSYRCMCNNKSYPVP